jgi:hypothetical protein
METLVLLSGETCARVFGVLRVANPPGVSLRELGRLARVSLSSLQRELTRLRGLGVVREQREGQRLLLSLRRNDPVTRVLLAGLIARDLQGTFFERFPADRDTEEGFVRFCAFVPPDPELWAKFGDPRFLSGMAVWLSAHTGFDRSTYLGLADALQPGASTLDAYRRWHETYRPDSSRLFGFIDRERQTYARVEVDS